MRAFLDHLAIPVELDGLQDSFRLLFYRIHGNDNGRVGLSLASAVAHWIGLLYEQSLLADRFERVPKADVGMK
jgi:hypothetical protein